MRTAASYYFADRATDRPSWPVPGFAGGVAAPDAKALAVDLDEGTATVLMAEATRQHVAPERLAEHVLLYFLADLDSGRLADRLRDAVQEDDA